LIASKTRVDIRPMTNAAILITRRALLGSSIAVMAVPSLSPPTNAQEITMADTEPFWPNNARLAVSFSLMFEAGGPPIPPRCFLPYFGGRRPADLRRRRRHPRSDREGSARPADQRLLPIRRL